jgi:hypothetical protein
LSALTSSHPLKTGDEKGNQTTCNKLFDVISNPASTILICPMDCGTGFGLIDGKRKLAQERKIIRKDHLFVINKQEEPSRKGTHS